MLNKHTAEKVRTLCASPDELRCHLGRCRFVMVNSTRNAHSCSMQMTEDVRKYTAELGSAAEEALKKGLEARSKEFVEKGAEVYSKA